MLDLIREYSNATADFLRREVVGETEDVHGDVYEETDWVVGHADVTVRYEDLAGTDPEFEVEKTGYDENVSARLFAPIYINDEYDPGDRVRVNHRGQTHELRMVSITPHSFDMDDEGYALATLSDLGDEAVSDA